MKQIIIIGRMDNTQDHTFESANRVYDRHGSCPALNSNGGGNRQMKVVRNGIHRNQTGNKERLH